MTLFKLNMQSDSLYMEFSMAIKIIFFTLSLYEAKNFCLNEFFSMAKYLVNDEEIKLTDINDMKEFYFLQNFYKTKLFYFQELAHQNTKGQNESLITFVNNFLEANHIFHLTNDYASEIINKYLRVFEGQVILDSVFEFFDKKYLVKIDVFESIRMAFDYIGNIFNKIEKIIVNNFETVDAKDYGYINFDEFKQFLTILLKNSKCDFKWKLNEYFR